eukprot:4741498-Prymnesium_polylepis.1
MGQLLLARGAEPRRAAMGAAARSSVEARFSEAAFSEAFCAQLAAALPVSAGRRGGELARTLWAGRAEQSADRRRACRARAQTLGLWCANLQQGCGSSLNAVSARCSRSDRNRYSAVPRPRRCRLVGRQSARPRVTRM